MVFFRKHQIFFLIISLFASVYCSQSDSTQTYVIRDGDTLEAIANEFQMSIEELLSINNLKERKLPPIGTELKIKIREIKISEEKLSKTENLTPSNELWFPWYGYVYYVQLNDNIEKISKRFGTHVELISAMNNLRNNKIYLGQRLYMVPGFRFFSYSNGTPTNGSLSNAAALPPMPGVYYRKNLERRAYYANHKVVQWVIDAIAKVAYYFPDTSLAVVGDLSFEHGGTIARHASHRNGLDVDIGYYFLDNAELKTFKVADTGSIDSSRTALLIMGLFDSRMIDKIFIDKGLQDIIRFSINQISKGHPFYMSEWNKRVRHWPNHKDHMHVRFKNPATLFETEELDAP
ncbi:MAG: penicillin-insensitive murein endopeptidase [Candidatus Coatesbacteria bacterium]|nr:penicillin-insensitive murein endopeptidase [Candidatus Coatesbacteria bacterium]